ncbi:MAG TPA: hypothetical protein VK970_05070 [Candidatus Methylacidiphilales bacterium]|nr:hypothetical protein [Candidatus Methylacidiphilales bacterium]
MSPNGSSLSQPKPDAVASSATASRASAPPRIAAWQVAVLLSVVLLAVLWIALKPGSTWMPAYSYNVDRDTILYDLKTKARLAIVLDVGPHTFPNGTTDRSVRLRVVKGSDQWKKWGIHGETGWLPYSMVATNFLVRAVDP